MKMRLGLNLVSQVLLGLFGGTCDLFTIHGGGKRKHQNIGLYFD